MQTILMHSELHVWFPFRLSMDNEHHLIYPVGNQILDTQVYQSYNIGNRILTEPHNVVVAIHCCLVGHCNCAVIDIK